MKGKDIIYSIQADTSDIKAKLTQLQGDFKKMSKRTQQSASSMGNSFKQIANYAKAYIGVQSVKYLMTLAGEADSVSKSFYNMTANIKGGGESLLQSLKEASRGTVAELDIMKSSNLAISLMGEQIADNLPEMMRIAKASAKKEGVSTAKMFNDIIVASGRQSIMILDNLGISSVTAAKYQTEYAASLGKTRQQLDETEKRQAFFYAVMKAGKEVIDMTGAETLTFGEKLQVTKANMQDTAQFMAQRMQPAFETFIDTINDPEIGGTLRSVVTFIADGLGDVIILITAFIKYLQSVPAMLRQIKKDASDLISSDGKTRTYALIRQNVISKVNDLINTNPQAAVYYLKKNRKDLIHFGVDPGYIDFLLANAELTGKTSFYRKGGTSTASGTRGRRTTKGSSPAVSAGAGNNKKASISGDSFEERTVALKAMMTDYFESVANMHKESYDIMTSSLNSFGQANRQLVYDTLWGEGGWKNWQQNMSKVIKQLVADIVFLTIKMLALRAVMSSFGGVGFGGMVMGGMFQDGRVPVFQNGRVPVFSGGYIPSDHFAAYIGKNEAVVNAQSTRANADILRWMNQNKGQRFGGEKSTVVHTSIKLDGRTIANVVDTHRNRKARDMSAQNYNYRSVMK